MPKCRRKRSGKSVIEANGTRSVEGSIVRLSKLMIGNIERIFSLLCNKIIDLTPESMSRFRGLFINYVTNNVAESYQLENIGTTQLKPDKCKQPKARESRDKPRSYMLYDCPQNYRQTLSKSFQFQHINDSNLIYLTEA